MFSSPRDSSLMVVFGAPTYFLHPKCSLYSWIPSHQTDFKKKEKEEKKAFSGFCRHNPPGRPPVMLIHKNHCQVESRDCTRTPWVPCRGYSCMQQGVYCNLYSPHCFYRKTQPECQPIPELLRRDTSVEENCLYLHAWLPF